MNILRAGAIFIAFFLTSCSSKENYTPDSYLSIKEKDKVLMSIIRYLGKSPENVGVGERFDPKYNEYYFDIASRHKFELYYITEKEAHFFLISRPAPSLYEKRVATGGRLKFNGKGDLIEYEEIFRTWKMTDEDLKVKGPLLFDLMVKGKDLSPYYRTNSSEEYIEFPDEYNSYDKADRMWKVK